MKMIISGSGGLVGTSSVLHFSKNKNNKIIGIDNNARKYFFGEDGSVSKNIELLTKIQNYTHYNNSVIDKDFVFDLIKREKPDVIISAHGQPSHDWAAKDVFLDFNTNAVSVLNLLEATRQFAPSAVYLQLSSDKVYGINTDTKIKRKELETRFEYNDPKYEGIGIDEEMSIDQTLHSLFGASKVASDVMCQEYSEYYKMNVIVFRPSCITGSFHKGAELHGFLSYLCKCSIQNKKYIIYGNKGKKIRSNIHANDLVSAFDEVIQNPKPNIFNLGGSYKNSCSHLECIEKIKNMTGEELNYEYIDKPRIGDHIVYYENTSRFQSHYPNWRIQYSLDDIFEDIIEGFKNNNV